MANFADDLAVLKAVIRADLTKQEIKIICYFMKSSEKTMSCSNIKIADDLGIAQPNFQRSLKALMKKGVIGERYNKLYLKAKSGWRSQ